MAFFFTAVTPASKVGGSVWWLMWTLFAFLLHCSCTVAFSSCFEKLGEICILVNWSEKVVWWLFLVLTEWCNMLSWYTRKHTVVELCLVCRKEILFGSISTGAGTCSEIKLHSFIDNEYTVVERTICPGQMLITSVVCQKKKRGLCAISGLAYPS